MSAATPLSAYVCPKVAEVYALGVADERKRIGTALTALERDAGLEPLFVEGSPAARAVAGYVARVRRVVEGGA